MGHVSHMNAFVPDTQVTFVNVMHHLSYARCACDFVTPRMCARHVTHERTQTGGGFHLRKRVEESTGFEGQVAGQVTFY